MAIVTRVFVVTGMTRLSRVVSVVRASSVIAVSCVHPAVCDAGLGGLFMTPCRPGCSLLLEVLLWFA